MPLIEEERLRGMIEKLKLDEQLEKNSHEEFLEEYFRSNCRIVRDLRIHESRPPRIDEREEIAFSFGRDVGDKTFEDRKRFGAHLDVVTTMAAFEFNQEQIVATASEDCLIKIWNVSKAIKEDNPEPLHTLRKHTGPLFSLACCPNPRNSSERLLFSGGIEGYIKSWRLEISSVQWVKNHSNGDN